MRRLLFWGLCAALLAPRALHAQPAVAGYTTYGELVDRLTELDRSDLVSLESLAKTIGKRDLWLLTITAQGKDREAHPGDKPAILMLGNVEAAHLVGSELAMRIAQQLVAKAAGDDAVQKLLERFTLYVIPRPNPDASEAFFRTPHQERNVNERATDDDRDGLVDEDEADDLNGDGQITMMRIEDDAGPLMPHPDDPRVLIEADPKKNERGKYRLFSEGRDNDGDEKFNEDGPGGVSFHRNFTHRYPFFQNGAGPHQVSEPETRAVADFAFSHPNIALVLTFSPEDNLMEPWKPGSGDERIKTSIQSGDADYVNLLAEEFRKIHGGKDAPSSPKGEGSPVDWAYFQLGRWSLASRGWWIPKTAAASPEGADGAKKASEEKRGADDLNALRWFAAEKIDGFVPWKKFEHPDFKGKVVEVGGFKPYLRLNPPVKELNPLAEKHLRFVVRLGELMPRLRIGEVKTDSLGGGVFRVTATVVNDGYLPTMPAMGKITGEPHPLQFQIKLGANQKLVTGSLRTQVDPLAGNGGQAERTWLVRSTATEPSQVTLKAWSPSVGSDERTLELKP